MQICSSTRLSNALVTVFGARHATGLIPDEALVDLSYRFVEELVDVEDVLGRARVDRQGRAALTSALSRCSERRRAAVLG